MPPDKSIPGSVQDWLVRAKGHLALAKQPKPEGAFWEDQCFLAQQAAEKALRGHLARRALAQQPQGPGLVAALLILAGDVERLRSALARLFHAARQQIGLAEAGDHGR